MASVMVIRDQKESIVAMALCLFIPANLPRHDALHDAGLDDCDGGSCLAGAWGCAASGRAWSLHGVMRRIHDGVSPHEAGSFHRAECFPCVREWEGAKSFHGALCFRGAVVLADCQHSCQSAPKVAGCHAGQTLSGGLGDRPGTAWVANRDQLTGFVRCLSVMRVLCGPSLPLPTRPDAQAQRADIFLLATMLR